VKRWTGMHPLLRRSFAAAFLSTLLHAQGRAPFTGTVRNEGGKALAGAEVTCVFVPDVATPGEPDQVTAKTDAGGAFRMELVVGCPYVVWSIGPAGERGVREIVRPRPDAAGGKKLDLTADERRGPVTVRVTGAAAWLNEGPLSLRVFVAGACQLAPDCLIPGDGPAHLPPLPVTRFAMALIDGKGQTLQVRNCQEQSPHVVFAEPREVPIVAMDAAGRPRPGVQVLQQIQLPGPSPDRLGNGYPLRMPMVRIAGVTGKDGKTVVRFAGEPGWLVGRFDGHEDCWSGWIPGARVEDARMRVHDGQAAENEGPLAFTMRPMPARTMRVLGLGADEHVEVSFRSCQAFLSRDPGGSLQSYLAASAADGVHAADHVPAGGPVTARVRLLDTSPVPRRIVGMTGGMDARLPDFDTCALRRMTVTVVEGARAALRPAPCAELAISESSSTLSVTWQDRLVTDANGRAELWLADKADWLVYATTGRSHAMKVVRKADPAAAIELQLEPLSVMRLRIVDRERRPVPGASLRYTCGGYGVLAQASENMALDAIAATTNGVALDLLRSDGAGVIEVPFVERERVITRFKVGAGGLQGGEWTLRTSDELQEIVVQ
jgi:hypothetical protein